MCLSKMQKIELSLWEERGGGENCKRGKLLLVHLDKIEESIISLIESNYRPLGRPRHNGGKGRRRTINFVGKKAISLQQVQHTVQHYSEVSL